MAKTIDREELVRTLRGQTFTIPDFEAMIAHWPRGVHVDLEELRDVTKARMGRLFSGERRRKMNIADTPLLGAMWWPYARSFEELCIANHLSTWLFAWDDETDSKEYSDLIDDFDKASEFRGRTVKYIEGCFSDERETRMAVSEPIITDFGPVGEGVFHRYTPEQSRTFLNEVLRFVQATETEQKRLLSGHLPTTEEYIHCRMSTSAVTPCLALTELCHGIEIPRSIITDPDMQKIWNATNLIISLMNDVLSVKKEIAQGQIDSILPLLYLEHGSLDKAMNIAEQWIGRAVQELDEAETAILHRYDAQRSDIQKMVDGCKYACAGNLSWRKVDLGTNGTQLTTAQSFVRSIQNWSNKHTKWYTYPSLEIMGKNIREGIV